MQLLCLRVFATIQRGKQREEAINCHFGPRQSDVGHAKQGASDNSGRAGLGIGVELNPHSVDWLPEKRGAIDS